MRTLRILICISLFVLSKSAAFSQSDEDKTYIPLEETFSNDGSSDDIKGDDTKLKRDLELLSVLPVITYNPEFDELCIESDIVNFDNVVYEICDVNASVVSYGTIISDQIID